MKPENRSFRSTCSNESKADRRGLSVRVPVCLILCFVIPMTFLQCSPVSDDMEGSYITQNKAEGNFPLSADGRSAPLYICAGDYPGVARVAELLQADIEKVSGTRPEIITDATPGSGPAVLIGTLGKNPMIDRLVEEKILDISAIEGKWESFLIQELEQPFPGVDQLLVIAGSDKRGTLYGMLDLSSNMGVSPWYWWADVPVPKQNSLYVLPGPHSNGEPAVRYRGIFINDEAPALSGWAYENFGGFNHAFYEHVFELILRMKGNFLWPAMWGRAFYDDDPKNPELADLYGIVIGTSHHEPMMRAHVEWSRYGSGAWNYEKNEEKLREFWKEGIERMGSYESLVTVGMRGDGDEPMTEGTAIELLERIVADQREILEDVSSKAAPEVPQVWALYKEVQEYYDKGMRVPEDVTLLLCDDNWGNIRKLPHPDSAPRPGGFGIYYHYDYVGGPRNYKWLNTNQIERAWEQMHLAYRHGVDRIWIVNVGDIKPMELPIQFFLDFAWDPDKFPAEQLPEYYRRWAEQQFGAEHAAEIGDILSLYTKFNSRRKPELLSQETYSQVNYLEAERIVDEYNQLTAQAEKIQDLLGPEYQDAYYQLVLFPVKACANLNELYATVGRNHFYAGQERSLTNELASRARELFALDSSITRYFHTGLSGGKWNHMMFQTHIGYTYWQQPPKNSMPEVKTIELPAVARMGVAVEGSEQHWPAVDKLEVPGEFDYLNRQSHYIEVFSRGTVPFDFSVEAGEPWIELSSDGGHAVDEERIWIGVVWEQVPEGNFTVPLTISGPEGSTAEVMLKVKNTPGSTPKSPEGYAERNGYVSVEAEHYAKAIANDSVRWLHIPNLGRTASAMCALPVTAPRIQPAGESPHLEYNICLFTAGTIKVHAYLSPTLDYYNTGGLHYGVSLDDGPVEIINMHEGSTFRTWEDWVSNNINIRVSEHEVSEPGNHVLKFWLVDPGVVLQKLVIETKPVNKSYLGPPESNYLTRTSLR